MPTTMRGHRVGIALAVACVMGVALVALGTQSALAQKEEVRSQKPADRVRALVLGKVSSPLFAELKRNQGWQLTQAANAQGRGNDPSKYDALVIDGDALSPEQLGEGTLVDRFADANRWVLSLDMDPADYDQGIIDHTGFTVGERSDKSSGFLFSRQMLNNSPRVVMIEADDLVPLRSENLSQEEIRSSTARQTREVASISTMAVSAGRSTLEEEYAPPGSTNPLPDEAQHVGWTYKDVGSSAPPQDGYWRGGRYCVGNCGEKSQEDAVVPEPGKQTANWTFNHMFDVYLDNADRPQGNFQYITYRLLGDFSPKRDGEDFFHMSDPMKFVQGGVELGPYQTERAWWTQQLGVQVSPDEKTGAKLVHQVSLPATPDEVTKYSTLQEFRVGITGSKEGPEVEGDYKVENGEEHEIRDWGVENKGHGNDLNWMFSARQPCDLRDEVLDTASCFGTEVIGGGMPKRPPDLSLNQLEVNATGRWRTEGLLSGEDGEANFRVKTPAVLADSVCTRMGPWPFGCAAGNAPKQVIRGAVGSNHDTDFWKSYGIDVGAVNPIPVESITFSPSPANGAKNEKVTGTVTLERPAPFDVKVLVFSNSENATVGTPVSDRVTKGKVTIPKGERGGTFQILTNDNRLSPGQHTTATITAFYTAPFQEQLRVESPPKGSPKP